MPPIKEELETTEENLTEELEESPSLEEESEDEEENPSNEEEDSQSDSSESKEEEEDDEVVLEFEEEEKPKEQDNSVIRTLRKQIREKEKRLRELEREREAAAKPKTELKKPKLEDYEFQEEFEEAYEQWREQKDAVEKEKEEQLRKRREIEQTWNERIETFQKNVESLKVKGKEEAVTSVVETLSPDWQKLFLEKGVLKEPHKLMVAVGADPKKLEILQQYERDNEPSAFVAQLARWEDKLKMSKRKPTTTPEPRVKGSAAGSEGSDAQLEKLEAKARITGDRTEIAKYRAKLREKARAKR